ncbi:hypothetical protein B0T16DRAFT_333277 [Cercophora newfieldiana]|uniref:Metallo-beta-lactamase domain-containing protein n=1 Tax=Cercophora newfieldiana TaxID=92897 RepID=A0AA39Y227_9PEZI|nr:hypothetical protein B0T16DRAFT_333277 [Cercophora newfieldiana]
MHHQDSNYDSLRLDTGFEVPPGAVAKVSIIDSTLRIYGLPPTDLVGPKIPGFDAFPLVPAWSFLVESSTGEKAIFDLAVPPNYNESFSPALLERVLGFGWDIHVEKHVADILRENGEDLESIGSVIWSHSHWDHIGDPTTFPHTTNLVVGPGFSKAVLPGYPINPESLVSEAYFENRTLIEVDFDKTPLRIGQFPALDFFNDGSFYLLSTPGHDTGHISALARTTTNPDTYILMGGDIAHHGAELRPSSDLPIPSNLTGLYPCPSSLEECPGPEDFAKLTASLGRNPAGPALEPAIFVNYTEAVGSIQKAQGLDARDDVWVVWAHDADIAGRVNFYPKRVNDWKAKGWKKQGEWLFLGDLARGAAKFECER